MSYIPPSKLVFTSSGTATTSSPGGATPATIALPSVDPSNLDMQISNSGSQAVWVSFSTPPVWLSFPVTADLVVANAGNGLVVPANSTLSLSSNATVLLSCLHAPNAPINPPASLGPSSGVTFSAASSCAICSPGFAGGNVTFQRGTFSIAPND